MDTLYHSSVHVGSVRERVLSDITKRGIRFPSYTDIQAPLRSTYTGSLVKDEGQGTLLEQVVDMILTQPVHWTKVVSEVLAALPKDVPIEIVNIGPGAGLMRSLKKSFSSRLVSSLDLSELDPNKQSKPLLPSQDPIAIVGMAVNMPGAPNSASLWDVLEKGLNTVVEASNLSSLIPMVLFLMSIRNLLLGSRESLQDLPLYDLE